MRKKCPHLVRLLNGINQQFTTCSAIALQSVNTSRGEFGMESAFHAAIQFQDTIQQQSMRDFSTRPKKHVKIIWLRAEVARESCSPISSAEFQHAPIAQAQCCSKANRILKALSAHA